MTELNDKFGNTGEGFSGTMKKHLEDDMIQLKGHFKLDRYKVDADGNKTYFDTPVDDPNLVVTMARKTMSRLCAGAVSGATIQTLGGPVVVATPSELYIDNMRWGTDGHNPSIPTEAVPPTASDEDLSAPLVSPASKPVIVDYPTDTSVRFTAELDQTEANGQGISEEGLFTNGGFLFARKTFGLLTKTSDFAFSFSHTISF